MVLSSTYAAWNMGLALFSCEALSDAALSAVFAVEITLT
jgi:hypothetical protein